MYDGADDFTYAYATSDDGLFSEATTIINEVDDIDEPGAMIPDSYHDCIDQSGKYTKKMHKVFYFIQQ